MSKHKTPKVKIKGIWYYRVRLAFPRDKETNIKPLPKSFYGLTEREAKQKAKDYKAPTVTGVDSKVLFVDFIRDEFIPQQEARVSRDDTERITFGVFSNRRSRMNRYIVEPTLAKIVNAPLRKVALAN